MTPTEQVELVLLRTRDLLRTAGAEYDADLVQKIDDGFAGHPGVHDDIWHNLGATLRLILLAPAAPTEPR